jgi:cell wall-associated NlpC family hydrolase
VSLEAANQGVQRARDAASELVLSALNFLDLAYRRGGTSAEEGFDCSGFVRHVFQTSAGLLLPRRSDEQARAASVLPISRDELKPGDLVFFNTLRRAFSHVGIYIGDGKFIHSPRTGSSIRIEDMRKDYWVTRFDGARRVAVLDAANGATSRTPSPP